MLVPDVSYETILNRSHKNGVFNPLELKTLRNQRILITGAGGSIGREIVRLLSKISGITILATDRDESALHSLSLEISDQALFQNDAFLLLDIRDFHGAFEIISDFKPTLIIHVAALKHLSVLEKQPREAILTNVFGSANLLEISQLLNIKHFVNVSTDKAANPISILGKSKFLTEIMTSKMRQDYSDGFTNVRFGNVYASRGSVIETFISQISKNQQITLTDPLAKRFFMHVEQAAFLTLKAFLINQDDIHIFDMGEPVFMIDVINRLKVQLGRDNPINVTGLRNGEKLDEELVSYGQILKRTSDSLIYSSSMVSFIKNYEGAMIAVKNRDYPKTLDLLTKAFSA